ncbi:hypothetical protein OYC64_011055 [Pagothenia borchgrevinki]|uniref:Calpastatin n=1 Tax=Pagothenia borchgrevinki TaxID=8213 RepID=A0ABD2GYZ1_PAGBO
MPHKSKKKGHGHDKDPKEAKEKGEAPASPQIHHSSRSSNSYSTAGSYYDKSQPSRATPKPAAQVSTGKPAQFEKAASGSAMASKPGVTTATGGATRSGVTAGGSASVGTAGKAKAETMAGTVIDMSSAGSTFVDMTSAGARAAPKEMPKTAAVSQVKATVPSPATGLTAVTKPKESPKGSAQSATATTTVKAEVPKVDTARPSKPTATAGNVSVQGKKEVTEMKVQAEIPPAAAKGAKEVDPFDALANILPSVGPAPVLPVYTGPEVVEHNIISETGQKCGERDSTLPPGYRFDDMPPVPADYKPKDVPKPLSTDEALDSLSFGFTSPAAPAAPKKQEVMTEMSATVPTVSVCPPPADKKAKMENDFSLESCLPAATATKAAPPVSSCKAPPADKKTKKLDTKPKTDGGDSMSLDALSALVDTLPEDLPKPDLPELRPEDIISEGKHKKEKGVFVGERDDSIAPEYRFNKEELKKVPALKPEPALGTADALDFLSGDFMDSSSAPPAQKAPVVAVCPPANKFMQEKIPDDFSLEAATATKVESNFAVCRGPPAGKKAEVEKTAAGKDKLKSGQGDSFSLDAFSALSDTLPADMPKPELPELRPEDIVSEGKHKKEKGVFVGEREDSIAPEYRFNKEEHKKLPVPKPEPTMGTADALDFLSGAFTDSSSAPPTQTKVEDLSALDMLSEDFVSTTKASGVQAPAPPATKKKTPERTVCPLERPNKVDVIQPKPKTDKGDSFSLDAFGALSDTLPKDLPKPELPKLRPEDIISEDKHKKEKGVFVGERDDSIPPEYRFNEEECNKRPAPKPEPSINTGDALDFLSGDFAFSSSAPVVQAPVITPSAPPAQPSADFALDALAEEFVSSSAASTVKSSACAPTESAADLAAGADNALDALEALDALSDTLKDITPVPMPAPVPTKDLVNEEKLKEERLIKMGERDDTLPPEYRPTGDIGKVPAKPKPKGKSMDDKTALDLLSSDFSAAASLPVAPVASGAATTKLEPPVLDSKPLKPMAGAVLDSLSSTLLPDAPEFIPKSDKQKKHHAEEPHSDQLPAQPSSDVMPKSTRKGGRS